MCPRGRPRGQGRPRRLHLWGSLLFSIILELLIILENLKFDFKFTFEGH